MGDEGDPGRLLAALEERAREERGLIEAEAAARASGIIAEAMQEAERIRTQARLQLSRELLVESKRLLGEARLRARIERLHAKRALLAEVFERAEAAVERLKGSPGYRGALDTLAAEARATVGEPCSVEVGEKDGSAVAISQDGRRRVDNSLGRRMAAARVVEEPEAARILFGERQGPARGPDGGDGSA